MGTVEQFPKEPWDRPLRRTWEDPRRVEKRERARRRVRFRSLRPSRWGSWLVMAVFVAGLVGVAAAEMAFPLAGCPIKGNVSASGERIYHMPGQRYYAATRINRLRGEQFFCWEWDARQAGFRKARV